MTMLALGHPILLRGMRTRDAMRDAGALKISMQLMVLTTPIRLNGFNLSVKKTLYMRLEGIENLLNIRLVLEEINPTET
jgi:hypothetical protein